ncbi:MAG: hypothetical protein GXP14_16790 [Gammaproteobacteria bacterium]|nr:hypothetical protein [Gammaproteobacteria bacterium]
MLIKLILVIILLALVSCDNSETQSRGMMGGMSMMGSADIQGKRPPLETNVKYVKGYQNAKKICAQCHTMPNPNLHTNSEWPNVIARMEKNIKSFNKEMPNRAVLQSIVDYYSANSK